MKAYVDPIPPTLSKSIHRLADALTAYAPPSVQIVSDYLEADFLLCHMIGQEGWEPYLERFTREGRSYGIWQHCLKTTRQPHPNDWNHLWSWARVVASCYDLAGMWTEAQIPPDTMEAAHFRTPNFVRLPLGVDTGIFRPSLMPVQQDGRPTRYLPLKSYLVGTSGYVAGMESVDLWAQVCSQPPHRRQFHLGPNLHLPGSVLYANGIPDSELARYWSQCFYVSGLRRSEGFELPAYEGLAAGARPVMFDREDARHWLGDKAEYIQEGSDLDIVEQLAVLVNGPYRAVTADEIRWVRDQFSWEKMVRGFWERVV